MMEYMTTNFGIIGKKKILLLIILITLFSVVYAQEEPPQETNEEVFDIGEIEPYTVIGTVESDNSEEKRRERARLVRENEIKNDLRQISHAVTGFALDYISDNFIATMCEQVYDSSEPIRDEPIHFSHIPAKNPGFCRDSTQTITQVSLLNKQPGLYSYSTTVTACGSDVLAELYLADCNPFCSKRAVIKRQTVAEGDSFVETAIFSSNIDVNGICVKTTPGKEICDYITVDVEEPKDAGLVVLGSSVLPACNNQIDDDNDGSIDLADIGCKNTTDNSETTECSDGKDNDKDGFIDIEDRGCVNLADEKEQVDFCKDIGSDGIQGKASRIFRNNQYEYDILVQMQLCEESTTYNLQAGDEIIEQGLLPPTTFYEYKKTYISLNEYDEICMKTAEPIAGKQENCFQVNQ